MKSMVKCRKCQESIVKQEAVEVTCSYFGKKSKRLIDHRVYFGPECFNQELMKWKSQSRKRAIAILQKYKLDFTEEEYYKQELFWEVFRALEILKRYLPSRCLTRDMFIADDGIQVLILIKASYKGEEFLFLSMGKQQELDKFINPEGQDTLPFRRG